MPAQHITAADPRRSACLERLAPEAKLVGVLAFVFAVVLTRREIWWAFAIDGLVVGAVALIARIPMRSLARRMTIELPFLAFAVLLPIVGRGPRIRFGGLRLSQAGLWSAWSIVAKGTLGVAATAVLVATTSVPQLLIAFERLRVPRTLTAVAAFMIRYADVVGDEVRRNRVARESRCDRSQWLWQAKAVGATAGTIFVRSYERGERVFIAMASRGYDAALPVLPADRRDRSDVICVVPAAIASGLALVGWWLQ